MIGCMASRWRKHGTIFTRSPKTAAIQRSWSVPLSLARLSNSWYTARLHSSGRTLIEKFPARGAHRTASTLGTAQIVLVSASIYQYTIVWAGDIVMSGYVTS